MNIHEKIHGFRVVRKIDAAEIGAVGYEMVYEKNGAKLLWLDRDDENKTFCISFRTTPEDDTGVFHILEHSVLCGSDRFPSKDPFVELLKGSLQTFLNAFTASDKTMYPVCSRNDKDFLNLMTVYLDAVLHPAMLKKPEIFWQEGWHFEPTEEGELTYKGVVFNEMRGAFSSPDRLGISTLAGLLYPDTTYGKESGGLPEAIPTLTYEQFVAAHNTFYHPSNSFIFLDGKVDIDAVLGRIDSFLAPYEKNEALFPIARQEPKERAESTIRFEIAPNESPENKGRVFCGMLACGFDEREKNLAYPILFDVIAGSNESVFKKRMLQTGLCEDAEIFFYNENLQNAVMMELRNVPDGRLVEAEATAKKILADIAREGIDKEQLSAAFNRFEFKTRERDFGSFPLGLAYGLDVMNTWLYGGDPIEPLLLDEVFGALRAKLSSRYFEDLLLSFAEAERGAATLFMLPDEALGAKRTAAEKERLAAIRAAMSDEEFAKIRRQNEELLLWQKTDDTPETIAKLPSLSLSDISDRPSETPSEKRTVCGVPALWHEIPTAGILYVSLYFDLSDLDEEDLFDLSLISSLLTDVRTERRSAIALQTEMKAGIGSFSASIFAATKDGVTTPYLKISGSVLESKKDALAPLLREILWESRFDEKEAIFNILRQKRMEQKDAFAAGGSSFAAMRASSYLHREGAIYEYTEGYEAYCRLKETERDFAHVFPSMDETFRALLGRVLCKARARFSLTGKDDPAFASAIVSLFPEGQKPAHPCAIAPLGIRKEGILIPAQIGYAGMVCDLNEVGKRRTGAMLVARSILSYSYLWNAIRVQGGAYGAGFGARINGTVICHSYRDPDPKHSLSVFDGCGDFLRGLCAPEANAELKKFIIGAIGESDPLYSPRRAAEFADALALRGIGYDDLCRERREILDTEKGDLLAFADTLDGLTKAYCLVASREKLDEAKDKIDTILDL